MMHIKIFHRNAILSTEVLRKRFEINLSERGPWFPLHRVIECKRLKLHRVTWRHQIRTNETLVVSSTVRGRCRLKFKGKDCSGQYTYECTLSKFSKTFPECNSNLIIHVHRGNRIFSSRSHHFVFYSQRSRRLYRLKLPSCTIPYYFFPRLIVLLFRTRYFKNAFIHYLSYSRW